MPLFNRKFILKQSHTGGAPNFVYAILQLPKRGVCSFASFTPSKPNTPYIHTPEVADTVFSTPDDGCVTPETCRVTWQ